MAQKMTATTKRGLIEIKKRLRAGKLTAADIKKLGKIVIQAENAAKALRAAVVE